MQAIKQRYGCVYVCVIINPNLSYLCVYVSMYMHVNTAERLQEHSAVNLLLIMKYSVLKNLLFSYNYTMQPYQYLICQEFHKENHPQNTITTSQAAKTDSRYKYHTFAVIILFSHNIYLIALMCSLIVWFINK